MPVRRSNSAFTLFEVILAVLLIAMIAVTVQRFVSAMMTGIEISQDRQRETEVTSSEDLEGEVQQSLSDLLARRATIQANRSGVQATLSALESAPAVDAARGRGDTAPASDPDGGSAQFAHARLESDVDLADTDLRNAGRP